MTADPIDMLMALRDRIDALMADEHKRAEKLVGEVAALERDLLLANALAALKAAAADCRHERVRSQVKGAREQIIKALAAA